MLCQGEKKPKLSPLWRGVWIHWFTWNKLPSSSCVLRVCSGAVMNGRHREQTASQFFFRGAYKKDGDKLFSRAYSDWTRGSGCKLKEAQFSPDIRKKIVTVRVVRRWHRLLREAEHYGCTILGSVQGQAGRSLEQPGLV